MTNVSENTFKGCMVQQFFVTILFLDMTFDNQKNWLMDICVHRLQLTESKGINV